MTHLLSHSIRWPIPKCAIAAERPRLSGFLARIPHRGTLKFWCAELLWRHAVVAVIAIAGLGIVSGCVVYEPAPAPSPSTFDRSWSAAVAAAQDEGVQILSEDRASGVIRGFRGDQEVTISLRSQADGNVRVEMSARGPKGSDPGLAGRISRAYDRRMGR